MLPRHPLRLLAQLDGDVLEGVAMEAAHAGAR